MHDLNRELIELIKENTKTITQLVTNQELAAKALSNLQDSVTESVNTNEDIISILNDYENNNDCKLYINTCSEINKILTNNDYKLKEIIYNLNSFKIIPKVINLIILLKVMFAIGGLWGIFQFIMFLT